MESNARLQTTPGTLFEVCAPERRGFALRDHAQRLIELAGLSVQHSTSVLEGFRVEPVQAHLLMRSGTEPLSKFAKPRGIRYTRWLIRLDGPHGSVF